MRLAIAAALAAMLTGSGTGCGSATPTTAEGTSDPSCAEAVLRDWAEGAIAGGYADDCYLAAIDSLPEDVRMYTSAEEDIARAMQSRGTAAPDAAAGPDTSEAVAATSSARQLSAARAETAEPSASRSLRLPPAPVLLLAGIGFVLVAGGVTASATRRIRRSR